MTTGICVNGFDGPQGGQYCLQSCFFRVVELELSPGILLGLLRIATSQLPESSPSEKRKANGSIIGKYIQINGSLVPSNAGATQGNLYLK